jgi:hypothetical protein
LLLACALVIGLSSPATAGGGTCYGDYCSNKDPVATRCATGAWTQRYVDVYYAKAIPFRNTTYAGRLELRASNTCGTQWARFTAASDIVYALRVVQPATGYKTSIENIPLGKDGWSRQIYSPKHCAYAWIQLYDPDSSDLIGPSQHKTSCV